MVTTKGVVGGLKMVTTDFNASSSNNNYISRSSITTSRADLPFHVVHPPAYYEVIITLKFISFKFKVTITLDVSDFISVNHHHLHYYCYY